MPCPILNKAYKTCLMHMHGACKQVRSHRDHCDADTYLGDSVQAFHKGLQTT